MNGKGAEAIPAHEIKHEHCFCKAQGADQENYSERGQDKQEQG